MKLFLFLLLEIGALALVCRRLSLLRARTSRFVSVPPKQVSELNALRRTLVARFLTEAVRDALLVTSVAIALLFLSVLIAELLGRSAPEIWAGKHFLAKIRNCVLIFKPIVSFTSLALGAIGLFLLARRAAKQLGLDLPPDLQQAQQRVSAKERSAVITELAASASDPHQTKTVGPWHLVWQHVPVVQARESLDRAWDALRQEILGSATASSGIVALSRPWSDNDLDRLRQQLTAAPPPAPRTASGGTSAPEPAAGTNAPRSAPILFDSYVDALRSFRAAAATAYMDVVNDPDRQPVGQGAPTNAQQIAANLLVNQSLHRSLRRTNRVAYYVSLALLVPAWVGIVGDPGLRAVSFNLTQLAITRQEAGQRESGRTDAQPSTPLTAQDRQIIRRVARHWEERTFHTPDPPGPPPHGKKTINPERPDWVSTEYETRSGVTREAILYEAAEDINARRPPDGRPDPKRKKRYEWATIHKQGGDPKYWYGGDPPQNPPPSDGPPLGGSETGGPFASDSSGPKPGSPYPGWDRSPTGAAALNNAAAKDARARQAQAILTAFEQPLATDGPVTEAGRAVEARITAECERSVPFLNNLRSHLATPVRMGETRGIVMTSMVDALVHVAIGGQGSIGDFEQAIWAFTNSSPSAALDLRDVHRVAAAQSEDALIREIRRGGNAEAVFAAVERAARRADDLISPAAREVQARLTVNLPRDNVFASAAEVFAQRPPAVSDRPEPGVNLRAAREVIQRDIDRVVKTASSRDRFHLASIAEGKTEALVTYDDYFPGHPGADETTERGALRKAYFPDPPAPPHVPTTAEVVEKPRQGSGFLETVANFFGSLGGGGTGGGSSERPIRFTSNPGVSELGWARGLRSRSFMSLRGFTRIGGVLIGRAPDIESPTTFTDLRWRWTPDHKIILTLVDKSGKSTDSAPYRPEIVAQALRYAADGRVTTATMVTADPVPSLRILLHPTLVDTPLGAQIQQLDRLVDTYAGDVQDGAAGAKRIGVTKEVAVQSEIYNGLWLLLVLKESKNSNSKPSLPESASAAIEDFLRFRSHLSAALRSGSIENEPLPSDYRSALNALSDAKRSPYAANPGLYEQSLLNALKSVGQDIDPTYGDLLKAIQNVEVNPSKAPIPWMPWSGVREKSFRIAAGDLLMPRGQNEFDLPFSFMWQIAFDTASDQKMVEPWEQPDLKLLVQRDVPRMAAGNLHDRGVMVDGREFVYLQRLFRSAFGGWLGLHFPIERLVELHRDVRGSAPAYQRTLRWNAAPTRTEIKSTLGLIDRLLHDVNGTDSASKLQKEKLVAYRQRFQNVLDLYDPLQLGRDADQIRADARAREAAVLRQNEHRSGETSTLGAAADALR